MEVSFKENLSKEELAGLAATFYEDPVHFCEVILGHWFKSPLAWFQRGILAILTRKSEFLSKYGELDLIYEAFVWRERPDDKDSPKVHLFEWNEKGGLDLVITQFTLLMIPRGFSKTTLINSFLLWNAAYREFNFVVRISETATAAELQLLNVKNEIEGNARFISIYGQLKPDQRMGLKWNEEMAQLTNGLVLVARGRGGQVRGLLIDGKRPDLIIPDDVEDKESVKTAEQRKKASDWFYGDVKPALPRGELNCGIVAVGTLLHQEALLAEIRNDPEWNTVILGASVTINGKEVALWDNTQYGMTLKKIQREKNSFSRKGKLHLFYMEFYNTIRGEQGQFKDRFFIIPSMPDPTLFPIRAIACDPAISDNPQADSFVLACVGMNPKGGMKMVLDIWGGIGVDPLEQVEQYFAMRLRWGRPRLSGIEAIAYQRALVSTVRGHMFRKKDYHEVVAIRHGKQSKDERIHGILYPMYAAGMVLHARHFPELESQLLDFPSGKKDYPDAVAMAVALLDPYAAANADPEKDLGADEFEKLDDEYFQNVP